MKRIIKIFVIALLFINILFYSNATLTYAQENDTSQSDIFYTHETDEYKINPTKSLLKYQIITDKSGNYTDKVSVIGSYIFDKGNIDETKANSEITIPEKVTSNEKMYTVIKTENTFYGKKEVKIVNFPDTIIEIGDNTLSESGITKFNMTINVKDLSPNAIRHCAYLKIVTVDQKNPYYKAEKNVLYSKDGKQLIITANLGKVINVKLGIEIIKSNAFANCIYILSNNRYTGLISYITLPSSIKVIEEYALPNFYTSTKLYKLTRYMRFNSNKPPKIYGDLSDFTFIVPANSSSNYKKINSTKVIEKISTKNKSNNTEFIKNIDWKKATGKSSNITAGEWKKLKTYYDNLTKDTKYMESKALISLKDLQNRIYLSSELYGSDGMGPLTFAFDYPELCKPYAVFIKNNRGTIRSKANELAITVLRTQNIPAVEGYYLNNGDNSLDAYLIIAKINERIVLIDINAELGTNFKTFQVPLDSIIPSWFDISRELFDISRKIFNISYYK